MTAPADRTIVADIVEGTPDGRPPLVLLHGPASDRSTWGLALAELCRIDPGRQVLSLDLPGHGGSAPWPHYDTDSVTDAVHAAVAWTRLRPPVVVGHATGALIAMHYAVRHPVLGVVNVDQWLVEPFLVPIQFAAGPDSGHVPHLARPARFAACLAATARWSATPGSGLP